MLSTGTGASRASYESDDMIKCLRERDLELVNVADFKRVLEKRGPMSLYVRTEAFQSIEAVSTDALSRAILGRGSFGCVYLVRNTADLQVYAIKVLSLNRTCHNGEESKKVWREARQHAQLQHRNIVSYKDCWQKQALLFIRMEYCKCSLHDVMPHTTADEAVKYVSQIASGLQYLHVRSITHRDVKADNILIKMDGDACLGDLGLSARTGGLSELMTNELESLQQRRGNIVYQSPESTPFGGSLDMWALGLVTCELVMRKIVSKYSKSMARKGNFPVHQDAKLVLDLKLNVASKNSKLAPVVEGLLEYDPIQRLKADQVIEILSARDEQSMQEISAAIKATIRAESRKLQQQMRDMKHNLNQLIINLTLNPQVRRIPTYVLILPKRHPKDGAFGWMQRLTDTASAMFKIRNYYSIYICDEGPSLLGKDAPDDFLHEPIQVSIPGNSMTSMAPLLRVMNAILLLTRVAAAPFGLSPLIPKEIPFVKELRKMGIDQVRQLQEKMMAVAPVGVFVAVDSGGTAQKDPAPPPTSMDSKAQKVVGESYRTLEALLCPPEKRKTPTNNKGETIESLLGTRFLLVLKDGNYHWVGRHHWPQLQKLGYQTQQQWAESTNYPPKAQSAQSEPPAIPADLKNVKVSTRTPSQVSAPSRIQPVSNVQNAPDLRKTINIRDAATTHDSNESLEKKSDKDNDQTSVSRVRNRPTVDVKHSVKTVTPLVSNEGSDAREEGEERLYTGHDV